jgi:hypothetical protein
MHEGGEGCSMGLASVHVPVHDPWSRGIRSGYSRHARENEGVIRVAGRGADRAGHSRECISGLWSCFHLRTARPPQVRPHPTSPVVLQAGVVRLCCRSAARIRAISRLRRSDSGDLCDLCRRRSDCDTVLVCFRKSWTARCRRASHWRRQVTAGAAFLSNESSTPSQGLGGLMTEYRRGSEASPSLAGMLRVHQP